MNRLRRYLLSTTSRVSIVQAWEAQAERSQSASFDTTASATPSLVDHDEPKASQPPLPLGGPS
jgi:hypothetical protein